MHQEKKKSAAGNDWERKEKMKMQRVKRSRTMFADADIRY